MFITAFKIKISKQSRVVQQRVVLWISVFQPAVRIPLVVREMLVDGTLKKSHFIKKI